MKIMEIGFIIIDIQLLAVLMNVNAADLFYKNVVKEEHITGSR